MGQKASGSHIPRQRTRGKATRSGRIPITTVVLLVVVAVVVWKSMEIYGNLASNMIKKSFINQHLSLELVYATILAGFASFFYADSCCRFVSWLVRSPFRD